MALAEEEQRIDSCIDNPLIHSEHAGYLPVPEIQKHWIYILQRSDLAIFMAGPGRNSTRNHNTSICKSFDRKMGTC